MSELTKFKVFDDKTLEDVFRDIYNNSKDKSSQLYGLIYDLKPMIKNIGDAAMLVPIIKEYMEVSVKNDEHLIKLANIVQKLVVGESKESEDKIISDEEKRQLLQEAEEIYKEVLK